MLYITLSRSFTEVSQCAGQFWNVERYGTDNNIHADKFWNGFENFYLCRHRNDNKNASSRSTYYICIRQVTRATHVRNRVCPRVELILKIIIILLIIFLGFIKSKPC